MNREIPSSLLRSPHTALAAVLAGGVVLFGAACEVEHYQFLADWTAEDGATESGDEVVADVEPDGDDAGGEDAGDLDGEEREEFDAALPCDPAEDGADGDSGCPADLTCCGEDHEMFCADLTSDERHCGECGQGCDPGEECVAGACRCSPGLVDCDGECVSLADDPEHCGRCDLACPADTSCVSGICEP